MSAYLWGEFSPQFLHRSNRAILGRMNEMRPERLPALEPDRPYTMSQVANAIGVSPKTVTRYRVNGAPVQGSNERLRLPAYRVGKSWRALGKDVMEWLRAIQPTNDGRTAALPPRRRQTADVDAQLDALGF